MGRVATETFIVKPPEAVFAYVTRPGHWPAWHPSSLGVSGATDHSLVEGEQVTEAFSVAGRRGEAVWTVIERVVPERWAISGHVGNSGGGTVTYSLTPERGGTRFRREFVYWFGNRLIGLIDPFLIRLRIRWESEEALRRLKVVLEAQP